MDLRFLLSLEYKKQETPFECLLYKILIYDFLRRHYPHQVKGSKFDYILSACLHKLPCFLICTYFTSIKEFIQVYSKKHNHLKIRCFIHTRKFKFFIHCTTKYAPTTTDQCVLLKFASLFNNIIFNQFLMI